MATITALGTTYNLPNYTGELFNTSVQDAPLLSMIGGLSGGMQTQSNEFEWEAETLRTPTYQNVQLEGAAAPTTTSQTRTQVKNIVEIHQSQISVSYTKLAAVQQKAGINNAALNPITDELSHQIGLETKTTAREINYDFWYGVVNRPANNSTAKKTDGLANVVTTNVTDLSGGAIPAFTTATNGTFTSTAHGMAVGATLYFDTIVTNTEVLAAQTPAVPYYVNTVPTANTFTVAANKGGATITFASTGSGTGHTGTAMTSALVLDTLSNIFQNGGLTDSESYTIWCNAWNKRVLTAAFITNSGYRQESRTVGGVRVESIITDFGNLDITIDRTLGAGDVFITTTSELAPVFLDVPGKGHFFVEEKASTGASLNYMLYGEVGLKYGAQQHHGRIKNTTAW